MLDLDQIGSRFMSVVPERRRAQAHEALAVVFQGYLAGQIFNADYKDAKGTIDHCVGEGYREYAERRFPWGKGYTPEYHISSTIGPVTSVYSIIPLVKKLAKIKPPGEYGDDLRAFAEATLPLAQLMAELKDKVVKGRKPNPEAAARAAAALAKKTMRTCACCFRSIAMLDTGLIADHGYRLPDRWAKTASCPGQRFRPLEVSSEGLEYMVKALARRIDLLAEYIAEVGDLKKLEHVDWNRKTTILTPESPHWPAAIRDHRSRLESEMSQTKQQLADYRSKLASWKPA